MKHKPTKKQRASTVIEKNDWTIIQQDTIFEKHIWWIIFGLVSILLLVIFHEFIMGKLYYLFSDIAMDSLDISYPSLMHATKYIRSEGFPLWSFSQGMGQNIMSNSLKDPFYWIVYLAGTTYVAYAIIWMEIGKILIAAFIFYHFLKCWNLSSLTIIIGTLLYCFCGFMVIGGEWMVFSTEAVYLAALLLSFEKLYQQNSWYLFPPVIALISIHNPFELYLSGVFLFAYFLFRHFLSEDPSFKKFSTVGIKLVGFGLLGITISSFIFIANCQLLIESPRVSGNFAYFKTLLSTPIFSFEKLDHYITVIARFFSNDLLGNGVAYTGWHNYLEAPLVYIGLLPLLLLPQIFLFSDNRKKVIYAIFVFVIFIPVIFPFFRYALYLFSGDYYRSYSVYISLTILLLSLFAMDKIDRKNSLNSYVLLGTLVSLLIIIYFPLPNIVTNIVANPNDITTYKMQYPTGNIHINIDIRSKIRNFLLMYTVLIYLLTCYNYKLILKVLLIVLVTMEIGYMNTQSLNNRHAISSTKLNGKFDYNDYSKDAIDYINSLDMTFFRINKSFRHGLTITTIPYNDSKAQGYFGTPSYDSFNQKYYIRFLEELDIIEKGIELKSRYSIGLIFQPLLWSIASVKYHLSDKPDNLAIMLGYVPIAQFGDVLIYGNNHFIPLGFTYNQYVPLSQFRELTQNQKQIIMQKAFVAEEPIDYEVKKKLKEINLRDMTKNRTTYDYFHDIELLKQNTLNISKFSQNYINGKIKLDAPKLLFFSIPYDKGWNAIIDEKRVEPILCNTGFIGFLLDPGEHNIELIYKPSFFTMSLILSITGLCIYIMLLLFNRRSIIKS